MNTKFHHGGIIQVNLDYKIKEALKLQILRLEDCIWDLRKEDDDTISDMKDYIANIKILLSNLFIASENKPERQTTE